MSNIIKSSAAVKTNAEPFVLKPLSRPAGADEQAGGKKAGGNIVDMEREAYESGFMAGEKAGFELGRQKAEVVFNGLSGILEELAGYKEGLYKECEKEVVGLCLAIAKKAAQIEVEKNGDAVMGSVREALKAVVAAGKIVIKINPKDIATLNQYKAELSRYGDGVKGVTIEGDENVLKGGCVIETNYGEVDATIDTIMFGIEERLKNAY
ncbi:MAG: FliH/SctL family protein [Deltaproteobacteria bacterium]